MSQPSSTAVIPAVGWRGNAHRNWSGLLLSVVVAVASAFIADHRGGPTLLYALLLGMALNPLAVEGKAKPGVDFAARRILRFGVALLGARITFDQIGGLGWYSGVLIVAGIVFTIAVGVALARMLGLSRRIGILTGGATAICGASAAIAIASVLPRNETSERELIFTIAGVTALSTIAMVLYPLVVAWAGLDPHQAGIFLGGTIHDVAQVVGAGYSLSHETGDIATLVKLMRVAMLLPVIVLAATLARARVSDGSARPPLLPGFAVAFALLVALNSTGWIGQPAQAVAGDVSRWCLVASIAGIGMKTQLREVADVGLKPILLMLGETAFLAALVLGMLHFGA